MNTPLYEFGSMVKVYTSTPFQDVPTETPTDPEVVSASVRAPDGSDLVYVYGVDDALVNDDVGVYHINIDANQGGVWHVGFYSEGDLQAADELRFEVKHAYSRDE